MKDLLKELIKEALIKLNIESTNIMVEIPANNTNGDYSSNIALQLSKVLKENSKDIALKIKENISSDKIDKIEIAGPGFLNFYMN